MRIRFDSRNRRWAVSVSAGFVLALAVLVYVNASATLSREEAQARVRLVLQRAAVQRHARSAGDTASMQALARSLAGVRATKLNALEVGKLLPDYVLRPHRPTHVVRVEVIAPGRAPAVRYFSLPWDGIDRESGEAAWSLAY